MHLGFELSLLHFLPNLGAFHALRCAPTFCEIKIFTLSIPVMVIAAANEVKPRSLHNSTKFFFLAEKLIELSVLITMSIELSMLDVGGVVKRTSSMAWTTPLPAVTSDKVTVALPNITLPNNFKNVMSGHIYGLGNSPNAAFFHCQVQTSQIYQRTFNVP
jgi:hypothetical protein